MINEELIVKFAIFFIICGSLFVMVVLPILLLTIWKDTDISFIGWILIAMDACAIIFGIWDNKKKEK